MGAPTPTHGLERLLVARPTSSTLWSSAVYGLFQAQDSNSASWTTGC